MRPITSRSLRGIALGVLLTAVLSSTGCYRSQMYPGNGYGTPMYGNQYPGYGGYQGMGIQTQTPGTYYAPGTTAPTMNSNGLTPIPDSNTGGSSGVGGGSSNDGGDAQPYSPSTDPQSRPVPQYPPEDNEQIQENNSGTGAPAAQLEPAPAIGWDEPPIKTASGSEEGATEPESTEPVPAPAPGEPEPEATEATEEPEDEEPPLLAPPVPE